MNYFTAPANLFDPVKVFFLDDNREFLDALELEFSSKIKMRSNTNHEIVYQEITRPSAFTFTETFVVNC